MFFYLITSKFMTEEKICHLLLLHYYHYLSENIPNKCAYTLHVQWELVFEVSIIHTIGISYMLLQLRYIFNKY